MTLVADPTKQAVTQPKQSQKTATQQPTTPHVVAAEAKTPVASPKVLETSQVKPVDAKPVCTRTMALVIDDEHANRDFLVRLLQQASLDVHGADGGATAMKIVEECGDSLKLIMLDYELRDQSGPELLKILRERLPDTKIVMATMHDDRSIIREVFALGCTAFLVKPHGFMELFQMVLKATKASENLDCLNELIIDQYGSRRWRK